MKKRVFRERNTQDDKIVIPVENKPKKTVKTTKEVE